MTKQKYKLSKRAQEYLKAQGGLQVPYEYPYQDNTSPFDLGQIDPSLFQAQQNQMVKPPQISQGIQQPTSNVGNILSTVGEGIPLVGSALKLGTGIYSLIQAGKEKKKAKRMEVNAQRDLERRMKESRENDFYYTGQTSGNYSDYNKKGGLVYQQGGFIDFYQNQEQLNKQTQNIWADYYDQYVDNQKAKAQQLKQEGLSNTIGGGLGLASSVLSMGMMKRGGVLSKALKYQNGGEFAKGFLNTSPMVRSTTQTTLSNLNPEHFNMFHPDTVTNESINRDREAYIWNYKKNNQPMFDLIMGRDPEKIRIKPYRAFDKSLRMKQDGGMMEESNEDLYSADFQSPVQNNQQDTQSYFTEIMNKYQALDPQGSLENKAMSWIFEEEQEPKRYNISDVFGSQQELPVQPVIQKFSELGIGIGSINTGTHNTGSKHYSGKAFYIPGSKNGGKEGLRKIYAFLNSPEGRAQFPNIKVIDEIDASAGKVGDANHIHVELLN